MKFRKMSVLACGAVLGVLAGCTSIPLSTMWHFRNFGPNTLVDLDPAGVRSALRTWEGLDLNSGAPELKVTLEVADEQTQHYTMTMTRLTGTEAAEQKLPDPGSDREWYIFKLTPAGVAAFRRMQQALKAGMAASKKGKHKQTTLTIHFSTEDMHPSATAKKRMQQVGKVPVQIRLQLKPGDGYYTFYEGKVPLKEGESEAAPGGI